MKLSNFLFLFSWVKFHSIRPMCVICLTSDLFCHIASHTLIMQIYNTWMLTSQALGIIYTPKIMESVCTAMHFVVLWGIELKVGMGVGDGPTRFVHIFLKWPHLGSKVIQGSICLQNALWLPNLVRTPDQSVVHCWGQRSYRGHRSQLGVRLLRNALWLPNLVGRIPDQSVMHCWGEGHVGVSWGQVRVNLLISALWPPNLVGRTPDQSVMHCGVKGHAGVSWGQPEVKWLRNAIWPPNLIGRPANQSGTHCWGQRSCKRQPGSARGQIP